MVNDDIHKVRKHDFHVSVQKVTLRLFYHVVNFQIVARRELEISKNAGRLADKETSFHEFMVI